MKPNQDKILNHTQNCSFYNEIADNYDSMMDQEILNGITRQKVADKFYNIIKSGEILDFGGGTGRDIEWLTHKGYRIIFCEPSEKMREKASELNKNNLTNADLVFVDPARTDFTKWHKELPFSQKVDAILANFAVINCIADIELLFQNLALVLKPGGHLLALVLHQRFKKTLGSWLFQEGMSLLFRKPVNFQVRFREQKHTVWVYSTREIKRFSAPSFHFSSRENLKKYGFSLVHLIRK